MKKPANLVYGADEQPPRVVTVISAVQHIGVVSIFSLVAVWKDFLWPLLVEYGYNPNRETLNVGIFEAASTTPQNLVLAASAMAAVPTLVFFLIFQRNILSGLTAGSLKG